MKRLILLLFLCVNYSVFAQEYEELLMVGAINELRMNPKGFIPHIEDYIKKLEQQNEDGGLKFTYKPKKIVFKSLVERNDSVISEAKSLISILKRQKSLKPLYFNENIYAMTKNQANYLSDIKKITHNRPDNISLYDTVKEASFKFSENCISSDGKSVYECLVVLLIDFRVKDKTHRYNLLDEKAKQVSVAKSGNYWVQNFIKN